MDEREKQPTFGMRSQFERECKGKEMAVAELFEQERYDPTIKRFIDMWQAGLFPSFENMLCSLVVQLSTEKDTIQKLLLNFHNTMPNPLVLRIDD